MPRNTISKLSKLLSLTLALTMGLAGATTAAENKPQLHIPTSRPRPVRPAEPPRFENDIIMVMPNAGTDSDDIKESMEAVHGTVVGSIGQGKLKVLLIKTEKNKFAETEKKLSKDKHFKALQRNYYARAQAAPPNDPRFVNQWHMGAINALKAWDYTQGNGVKIGIFDSGCQAGISDLSGKTNKGYDAWGAASQIATGLLGPLGTALSMIDNDGAQTDVHGHGTTVATTACATSNNMVNSAGVAPKAIVEPVQIAGEGGWTEDLAIIAGLNYAMMNGLKIVNISYNAPPPVSFSNAAIHPALHAYMAAFHDVYGGIIFLSSGNDAMFDPTPVMPYVNVVSACDNGYGLASFSTYGLNTTFTAPGTAIPCSRRDGSPASVQGTSFSAPICAAIAALVWSANPGLSNVQVETIMKASCNQAGGGWNPYFGFGMPDAEKAVKMAKGVF